MTFSLEKLRARKKRHYEKRKSHILARNKKYVEEHREKIRAYHKKYNELNKEKIRMYRVANRESARQKDNEHYQRTKERHREVWASKKYGISVEGYRNLVQRHEGKCGLCGEPEISKDKQGNVKRLAVDHRHKDGKVRGLLCQRCNQAIGLLREDLSLIKKVIKYLYA